MGGCRDGAPGRWGWVCFGEQVRAHRRRLGLSQEDLADEAGIDPKTIRSIEGGRSKPRPATVRRLADAFGLAGASRDQFCASVASESNRPAADPEPNPVAPAQLPRDLPGFAGRHHELNQLDHLLTTATEGTRTTEPVAVISGMAGIGKTTLAVRWAHRVRDRYPDGHLYLNLHGFDPDGRVMAATEAIRVLLDALGVPTGRVPAEFDAQVGLYRSLLAGKRILVVLDNARDADQARPLLPGEPGCLAVVTSRNQLTGLVATHGAHLLGLDLLTTVEARELVTRRLDGTRVPVEPGAVDAIVVASARLPLALAIAAARASGTGFALAAIADELRDSVRRLDALDAGDPCAQIRAVFSWSYAALSQPAARLFRLLGLHPGPEVTASAAASLSGYPLAQTRRLLAELVCTNLLAEPTPGRFTCHDLLHLYAADLVGTVDADPARRAALLRLLDHYTYTSHAADRLLYPHRDPMQPPLSRRKGDLIVTRFTTDKQAMAWFAAEHRVLLAVQRLAADAGLDTHAWQLAWTLDTFLLRRGYRHDLASAWTTARYAADRLADPSMQAYAHRALVVMNMELRHYNEAHQHAEHALKPYIHIGDLVGQAHTYRAVAYLCWQQGDPQRALHHAEHALALFRAAGHQHGIANGLNGVGWYHAELGHNTEALAYCEQALALLNQLGDQVGAAYTWDSLGYAHHHLGHHDRAIDCYQRALTLNRHLGDLNDQANTLTRLGDTHHAAGHPDAARHAWQQALHILTDLNHPDADLLRRKLGHSMCG